MRSLWEDDFDIPNDQEESKKISKTLKSQQKQKVITDPNKALKSSSVPIEEKMAIIRENVIRILGVYANDTLVIKTKEQFVEYIDKALKNGVIAIDTETNNSLDPLTCLLMGPCIYTPGMKNAYIPINHVNYQTNERLSWQLTEKDVAEQFHRLTEANTTIIMHNGKFDYQVIKCTTGEELHIDWDTLIGARILNENELAGLKSQYVTKIDPSIEKYDIEHLFQGLPYAIFEPELFALYASTDAYMTYKLYIWQKEQFELSENKSLWFVFHNIEMPIVKITAEMELHGVYIDKEYSESLSKYYHEEYNKLESEMYLELASYENKINQFKLSTVANERPRVYWDKKEPPTTNSEQYSIDENGKYYKLGKSKSQQLSNPVNLSSPTQLAILLYDILGVEEGIAQKQKRGENKPLRGTGEDIIKAIQDKYGFKLCELILKNRELLKLINTYIDKIPQCVNEKDGRVHTHFNSIGADTGRFSSSDPINLQNIPSHNHLVRSLFRAPVYYGIAELNPGNYYEVDTSQDVLTKEGWKRVKDLQIGDFVIGDDNVDTIKQIHTKNDKVYLVV